MKTNEINANPDFWIALPLFIPTTYNIYNTLFNGDLAWLSYRSWALSSRTAPDRLLSRSQPCDYHNSQRQPYHSMYIYIYISFQLRCVLACHPECGRYIFSRGMFLSTSHKMDNTSSSGVFSPTGHQVDETFFPPLPPLLPLGSSICTSLEPSIATDLHDNLLALGPRPQRIATMAIGCNRLFKLKGGFSAWQMSRAYGT